ncbi:hypothetical protein BJ973_008488 [Actinoplanes tereljensis]|uniref:Uncharacterized protein n=1 Tax=Paractinoplanes tereljensis TaxID=571912 RepID=A0A919NID6_9ACTN|nr:hypothetical protein [Actinoplanes tereljensis]GIF18551.1 hypothetical protein Ate02nite_12810 [Actinoplanes tereljensis]
MTRRRRTARPVPLTPLHRRDWHTLWRRCTCGLTSPCVDRTVPAKPRPFPPPPPAPIHTRRALPTYSEYLATIPFPVYCGFAAMRNFSSELPP